MNKLSIIISIIVWALTILDLIFKYIDKISYLTNPIFKINILEVIIIVLIIIITYDFIPKNYKKININYRAERFYKNWIKFKDILIEYDLTQNEKLQNKYSKLREIINTDFNFFKSDFIKIEKEKNPKYNWVFLWLNNLWQLFSVREILKWQEEVKRSIPKELDCFDWMILWVKEYIKRNN